MRDWLGRSKARRTLDWLAVDSWIDSGLHNAWQAIKDGWSAYSSFFARFRLRGWKRLANEGASEAATMGTGALAVMLAFAIPAFEETATDWRTAGQYSVTFLDRYGNEIGKRGILHSDAVPLEDLPDHLIRATLATEDRRFYEHFGLDWIGTLRAMAENVRARDVVQGGSSITQQLAKNLFLSPEQTLDRKIKEAFLAIWLEARLTKDEILKLYLDRAYLGAGAFGVEAASEFYFGKSAREVTLAEAALLAGLFKAPSRFAPHVNLPAARGRANQVLTNMVAAGYLSEGQVYGARLNPAQIVDRRDYYSPDWYLDWAFEEIQRIMRGRGEYVLTARTTVDTEMQQAAESSLVNTLRTEGRGMRVGEGALVAMETNGAVRALVGGQDYGESQFNRASHARRQPGSSFKPYVYLTALQNGFTPDSAVVDGPVSCGRWSPRNYSGGFAGRMSMAQALARSINTVAVKLSLQVGRDKVLEDAQKLGLTTIARSCSMALGDTGITPLQHTAGFAVFAAGGKSVRPFAITEIHNSRGDLVFEHERDAPPQEQIFEPRYIEQLNEMLGLVVTGGTGRRAELDFTYVAGKTGTSSAHRDAWFVGYTGQYVAGVWVGNDNFTPMGRVTGGSLPAMAWKDFMVFAHPHRNIPQIPGLPIHPEQQRELERIAQLQRENPSLAPIEAPEQRMSSETRQILERLSALFRNPEPTPAADSGTQDRAEASQGAADRTATTAPLRDSALRPDGGGWQPGLRFLDRGEIR